MQLAPQSTAPDRFSSDGYVLSSAKLSRWVAATPSLTGEYFWRAPAIFQDWITTQSTGGVSAAGALPLSDLEMADRSDLASVNAAGEPS